MGILAGAAVHILPRLMIFLYIAFFVYVTILFRRLVLAVEGIARKIEGAGENKNP